MRTWSRIALLLAAASSLAALPAAAQPAATLKLSWDHCAGDGLVADRSFACDTNTGGETLWASVVAHDGVARTGVVGFTAIVDFRTTSPAVPSWWQSGLGQCRANAVTLFAGPFTSGGACEPWYVSGGAEAPLGVLAIQPAVEGPDNVRLMLATAVPVGNEATLAAGQEHLLFRIQISHAKSAGAGACEGCLVPTCIGFGLLKLEYGSGTTPAEQFTGGPGSAVTWQGAYVASYAPADPPGATPYWSYLDCATGPVPARGRTWGLIKTLYR